MRLAAVVLMVAVAGCATATMDHVMRSWEGEHVDAVIKQWGMPNAEREFRGQKVYLWNTASVYSMPSSGIAAGKVEPTSTGAKGSVITANTGGGAVPVTCERAITVNDAGNILSATWRGDGCCFAIVAGECGRWPNPARPRH